MELLDIKKELKSNTYPGRGIICGKSSDGKYAMCAYFIMGRSVNSRNRIFVETEDGIKTKAFDESKLSDPSLIIYSPVRIKDNFTIITNGDQTDTIYDGLTASKSFEESLRSRKYEPDEPNYTPRISAAVELIEGRYILLMSILKSDDNRKDNCLRYTFTYDNLFPKEGRFIHTYMSDGNPLPSFSGEPKKVDIFSDNLDEFARGIWESLNEDNKVSLFVRKIEIATGKYQSKIINKLS